MNRVCRTFVLFLFIQLAAIDSGAQLFRSLSAKETGISFSNDINETENLNVLAYEYFYNGGGVAAGDINNDGLEDLFFTANMKPNKLFLNLGGMKFKDITKEAGVEGRNNAWKTGVTMADVNGDGLLDVYVCYSGKVSDEARRNQLFINKGNGKFSEEGKQFGLDDKSYSTQAAFFDFDNDGDLDMFLLNHSTKKIDNMELARYRNEVDSLAGSKLYENRNNRFVDVSAKAGIRQNPLNFGLGIAVADINKDGWQDVYVSNDYNEPDYLYLNKGDGTFKDDAQNCLSHLSHFSMGVDIADFNNDGLPDIMTLDMLPEDNRRQKLLQLQENYESFQLMQSQGLYKQYMRNMLHLNNGDGTFSEIAQASGVSNTDWSWTPLFADFDNDGYKDLFVTNGYLRDYTNKDFLRYWGDYKIKKAMDREPTKLMDLVTAMPSTTLYNYIFKNNKDLTFSNQKAEWGMNEPGISSGAVFADLDNDGDLDLIVNRINQNAGIYQNRQQEEKKKPFLSIRLRYKDANTNAVGSRIYVYSNGIKQYGEVNPNRGYLSCLPLAAHFGFGETAKVDSINVIWPDGTSQFLSNVSVNQSLTVTYSNTVKPIKHQTASRTVFSKGNDVLNYKNISFDENDFKRQPLMMFMYSKTGPVTAKADVNKDGLDDLFVSGDKTNPGKIYVQQKNGTFAPINGLTVGDETISATSAAAFADVNNDGYVDLYVAKGGYSLFEPNTAALQDELYLNDGKGSFSIAAGALPDVSESAKSCVRACDYDKDGDIDFFVGGRVVPGRYPMAPVSYLLNNDGKGKFAVINTAFSQIGMVTDAQWADLNDDGKQDLVLCGEFMPVSIFINSTTGFTNKTAEYFSQPDNGLWHSLNVADLDGDKKPDITAGNIGRNTQIHFSAKEPAELYFSDFDGNGSIDPFLNFYVQGTSYPFVSRDELNDQIYGMRKKFTSYKDYSGAVMSNIFSTDDLAKAGKLMATECNTVCYLNRNGKFEKLILPVEAQFSAITKIMANDFDGDGKQDVLLLGNRSDNRLKIGSIDANYGCLMKGIGNGQFAYVPQTRSGLSVKGDVKSAEIINVGNEKYICIGVADGPMYFYKIN
jgi:hypothetical protein